MKSALGALVILAAFLTLPAFLTSGCAREKEQPRPVEKPPTPSPDSVQPPSPPPDAARALSPHPIDRIEIERLRRLGLEDPIRDLIADLRSHPEVLPFQRQEGMSRFAFYDSTRIRVLTGHWVYAYTEDGHVVRDVLLRYTVHKGGRIDWKVVAVDEG